MTQEFTIAPNWSSAEVTLEKANEIYDKYLMALKRNPTDRDNAKAVLTASIQIALREAHNDGIAHGKYLEITGSDK